MVLFEGEAGAVARARPLRRVDQVLEEVAPDAVAIPGCSEPAALA